jgi:hypothetical protein
MLNLLYSDSLAYQVATLQEQLANFSRPEIPFCGFWRPPTATIYDTCNKIVIYYCFESGLGFGAGASGATWSYNVLYSQE